MLAPLVPAAHPLAPERRHRTPTIDERSTRQNGTPFVQEPPPTSAWTRGGDHPDARHGRTLARARCLKSDTTMTSVLDRARAAAAALAAADGVYALLLARRARVIDTLLGPSTGIWRDWGVGCLAAYTGAQAAAAVSPTAESLGAFALLRGVCAAGHVSGFASATSSRRPIVAGLFVMNTSVAALAWRARRSLR